MWPSSTHMVGACLPPLAHGLAGPARNTDHAEQISRFGHGRLPSLVHAKADQPEFLRPILKHQVCPWWFLTSACLGTGASVKLQMSGM